MCSVSVECIRHGESFVSVVAFKNASLRFHSFKFLVKCSNQLLKVLFLSEYIDAWSHQFFPIHWAIPLIRDTKMYTKHWERCTLGQTRIETVVITPGQSFHPQGVSLFNGIIQCWISSSSPHGSTGTNYSQERVESNPAAYIIYLPFPPNLSRFQGLTYTRGKDK